MLSNLNFIYVCDRLVELQEELFMTIMLQLVLHFSQSKKPLILNYQFINFTDNGCVKLGK